MRHGVVDSSTATTVDVQLDGVVVTAFLLDGVTLSAGMVATLVQDGRRLVAVGGIDAGPAVSAVDICAAGSHTYGPITSWGDLTDESDSTYLTSDVGDVVDGTSTAYRIEFSGVGDGDEVTVTYKVRGSSSDVDPLPIYVDFGDNGGVVVDDDTSNLDDTTWTTVTYTWTVTGGGAYTSGSVGSANDVLIDLTTVTVTVA